MRIVCLLVITVMVAGLGLLPAPRTAAVPRVASTVTPAALIDLGAIFGDDENEPDENETDGDEQQQQQQHQQPSGRPALGSRISLPIVLVIAALGVMAAAFVVNRLRRLWARLKGLSARASAQVRGWGGSSRTRL
jgi:hypothetical protein